MDRTPAKRQEILGLVAKDSDAGQGLRAGEVMFCVII